MSCRPPDEERLWYETEEVEDPVLPFCSMLYQLAGKCNLFLSPGGKYDPTEVYSYEDSHFLLDTCELVETLNSKIEDQQPWVKKWADSVRMTRKAMSPASKAAFVSATLLLAGLAVVACMGWSMKTTDFKNLQPDDIQKIPSFNKPKKVKMGRKDSGVERARRECTSPNQSAFGRSRTAPDFL